MEKIEIKREREKKLIEEMIRLYCRKNHGGTDLCPECGELLMYSLSRIDRCPFMETKTFCSGCRVHCYSPDMRQQIRSVMRYAGPRMLMSHPVMVIRHMMESIKWKRKMEDKNEAF